MESQISKALEAQTLPFRRLTTKIPTFAEVEDMLRLSADFCLHSRQTRLISIYETLMTSTNRGKLLVSQSNPLVS